MTSDRIWEDRFKVHALRGSLRQCYHDMSRRHTAIRRVFGDVVEHNRSALRIALVQEMTERT